MNLDKYLSLIRNYVPKLELRKVEYDDKGWDNFVVVINQEWIFRFPRTEKVRQRIHKEQRLIEYLHQRLDNHDICIPRYRMLSDQNGKVVGCYYEMIQGQPLKPIHLQRMSHSVRTRIAVQIGTFLSILHTSNLQVVQNIGIEVVHTDDYWRWHLQEIHQHVLPLLTPVERIQVVDMFETYLEEKKGNPVPNTLTHGDLSYDHILYDPDKKVITGIIDFGDAQLTDPAYDFSGLYWDYDKEFVKAVLCHYVADQTPGSNARLLARVEKFFGKRKIFWDILHGIKEHDHELLQQSLDALRKSI